MILEHMEWWNRHQAMMGQDGAPEEHHIFLPVLIDQVRKCHALSDGVPCPKLS